ncbi:cilia- and flagella-associated protein HOATZ-like isoform X1 [Biomphalaria glabrata]|uniref:Cilia- and flagella-associated protein HOATZ n=1 Tax=Biomphalaria glabrata TaxID=6526 RepID=A0A9U8DYN9_BIOGL|nr:cilia- and flagella-associated protein HOATZ-like isoform X1 [Biomphalaria glabrata]
MAVKMLDLTKQAEKCTFNQSTSEEMTFAETFWHSVRLQPTMESRLVSSDIKQRLGIKKHTSKSSIETAQKESKQDDKLRALFVRAHALDQIAHYTRLQRLAEARIKELEVMKRRKEERLKKEEISKVKCAPQETKAVKEKANRKIGEAYSIKELIQELDEFDERIQIEEQKRKEARQNLISKIGNIH